MRALSALFCSKFRPATTALWAAMDSRDLVALLAALALKPALDAPSPRWRAPVDGARQTALFEAVTHQWVEGVELLLRHGAQPWATGSKGQCALEKAFDDIDEVPRVKEIWDAMLSVPGVCTQSNEQGQTLLHLVCVQSLCSTGALRKILQHPQDVNALDKSGRSAIAHLAQHPWNFGAIESLIEHGADPCHKGVNGRSAEEESKDCGHPGLPGQMMAWWRAKKLDALLPAEEGLALASARARL